MLKAIVTLKEGDKMVLTQTGGPFCGKARSTSSALFCWGWERPIRIPSQLFSGFLLTLPRGKFYFTPTTFQPGSMAEGFKNAPGPATWAAIGQVASDPLACCQTRSVQPPPSTSAVPTIFHLGSTWGWDKG
jgi:hypothetical protein